MAECWIRGGEEVVRTRERVRGKEQGLEQGARRDALLVDAAGWKLRWPEEQTLSIFERDCLRLRALKRSTGDEEEATRPLRRASRAQRYG